MDNEPKTQVGKDTEELLDQVNYTYVNTTGMLGTNWDFRIAFGDRLSSGKVESKLGVVMSLPHAKAFLEALQVMVERVEAKYGKIKHHSGLSTTEQ